MEINFKDLARKSNSRRLSNALARPSATILRSPLHASSTKATEMTQKVISPADCLPFIFFETSNSFAEAYHETCLGNFKQALSIYKSLLTQPDNKSEIQNNIGVCYSHLGSSEKAIKHLTLAISLKRTGFLPYYNLALIYISLENLSGCITIVDKAMIAIPNPPKDLYVIREHAAAMFSRKKSLDSMKVQRKLLDSKEDTSSCDNLAPMRRSSKERIRASSRSYLMKYSVVKDYEIDKILGHSSSKSPISVRRSTKDIHSLAATPKRTSLVSIKLQRKKNRSVATEGKTISKQKRPSHFYYNDFAKPRLNEKGLVQREESNITPTERIFGSASQVKTSKKRISFIRNTLEKEMNANLDDVEPMQIKSNYLTEQKIHFIISQYDKPFISRNNEEIDKYLCNLLFFAKFPYSVRLNIYKLGSICHYLPGKTIFKQGDLGDMIYVILKGSVSVEKISPELRNMSMVVNSLYDGKHFGEAVLVSSNRQHERSATLTCSEDSYFLTLLKKDYHQILLDLQREEIDQKALFFSELSIFKTLSPALLSTLATNIEISTYKLDEVIIHQGEIPRGLYIIYSGHAVLYTQGYRCKEKWGNQYSSPRKRREHLLRLGEPPKTMQEEIEESVIKRVLYSDVVLGDSESAEKIRKYVSPKKIEEAQRKDHPCYILKDWLEFASIHSTDYFGGRVLVCANDSDPALASKFTVVAKSSVTKLFVFDRTHMQLFSEEIVHHVKTILAKSFEVDCPPELNPDTLDKVLLEWQSFRENLIESINRNSYIDKNKIYFPFSRY